MDEFITFGSEVKALGNGRIGGYLVRFSDETTPDLAGDYFTKATDFYIEPGDSRFVLYDHGFDETLRRAKIGKGILKKIDEVGLWIEAQLGIRESYEKAVDDKRKKKLTDYAKAIYKLVEDGKLGWSSGAAGHLAERVEGRAANHLTEWGITEFSLTPRPCEPKNCVVPVKAYQEGECSSFEDLVKATWSAAFMNDLPDSSFLLVESGGEKDEDGKTTPRSLRHFPYKDADGKVDLPHLRNALARIPQSKLSDELKTKALKKARAAAKEAGIDATEPKSLRFGERISQLIADREEDGQERSAVIKALAAAAVIRPEQVEVIIAENQRPSNAVIKAFARVLNVEYSLLRELADKGTRKTIKGLFEEELANRTPSTWDLESAMRSVIKKIAEAATASAEAGGEYEWQPKVAETMNEYTTRMTELVITQVASWVAGEYEGDEFYLKSGIVIDRALVTGATLDFDEHSELVVTAVTELAKRFRDNHEMRVKAGRVLSEKNRNRLSKLVEQMMAAVTECQGLLEETKPIASEMDKNAAWINHQRIKHQLQRAQIGV